VLNTDNDNILKELKEQRAQNGRLFAIIDQKVLSQAQLERKTDSLAKLLKIKPKNIRGATVYTTIIDTLYKDSIIEVTTPENPTFIAEYVDAWIENKAVVNKDSGKLSLIIRDTPHIVQVYKNPLFKKPSLTTVVYHSNPHIKSDKGYSYTTKVKEPVLTIGPFIGYDPFQKRATLGFGASIPLIKIRR
jgi:hypothetical protein